MTPKFLFQPPEISHLKSVRRDRVQSFLQYPLLLLSAQRALNIIMSIDEVPDTTVLNSRNCEGGSSTEPTIAAEIPKHFPFFELPKEVRDRVYELTTFPLPEPWCEAIENCGRVCMLNCLEPAIFKVNRQFRQEAIDTLSRISMANIKLKSDWGACGKCEYTDDQEVHPARSALRFTNVANISYVVWEEYPEDSRDVLQDAARRLLENKSVLFKNIEILLLQIELDRDVPWQERFARSIRKDEEWKPQPGFWEMVGKVTPRLRVLRVRFNTYSSSAVEFGAPSEDLMAREEAKRNAPKRKTPGAEFELALDAGSVATEEAKKKAVRLFGAILNAPEAN